jgi:aminoglycoside phosphotransferase
MTSPLLHALRELLRGNGPMVGWDGADELDLVLVTPRFTASTHVVAVLVSERTAEPIAVVKIPRLRDSARGLEHEARTLRALESSRPGGYDTVPRVIAVAEWTGRPVLAQTALVGTHMDDHAVRRDPAVCIDDTLAWLRELPVTDGREPPHERYERLVVEPLTTLLARFRRLGEDTAVIGRTLEVLEPLRTASVPSVFEHGDLSYPNILRLQDGRVGVVDWELGEERSFPGRDLFFFLAFVALAERRARTPRERIGAFHDAYLRPDAWATAIAARDAERLEIDRSLLTPLFVACWARHSASWLARGFAAAEEDSPAERSAAAYIQGHFSFAFWDHTLRHLGALRWA